MQPRRRVTGVERLSASCNRFAEGGILLLGLLMTAVVIAQVFCRYVLNHSLFWSEELARYLLVWLTFLGASVAYHRRIHPGIDLLYRRLPSVARRSFRLVVQLFSLAFFLIMVWYGCRFAFFIRLQLTPALSLPKWLIFAIIPVSGAILSLHALAFICKDMFNTGEGS